jgi:hypothetical protein
MQNCGEIDDTQLAGDHRSRCGIHAARRCSAALPSLVPQILAGLATLAASIVDDAPHGAMRHFFRSHWKVILAMLLAMLPSAPE